MKFAEKLKELRLNERMTQQDLAQRLSVYQSNISDWENSISRPEYENLIQIAKFFNVSTDYLLGLED